MIAFLFLFIFLDFSLIFFNTKVLSPSGELELVSGFELFFEVDHGTVEFFELFFIKLSIVSHEDIVDFKVILFEFMVGQLEILKGSLLSFIFSKEVFEL